MKDDPRRIGFTWRRRGRKASRLDRVYVPEQLIGDLCSPAEHHSHQSDHDALVFELNKKLYSKRKKYESHFWKLNKAVLKEPEFLINFNGTLRNLLDKKCEFNNVSDWFDGAFKPTMKTFLINLSKLRSKSRKDTLNFLSVALQNAVQEQDHKTIDYVR